MKSIVKSDLMVKGSLRLAKVMARLLVLFTMARFKVSSLKTVRITLFLLVSTQTVYIAASQLITKTTGERPIT